MNAGPDRKPHHHGTLRQALVAAGVALLAEGGPSALTLRQCAARAGVSHAAPAHHFDGLTGLKAAIALEGFRIFRAAMLAAADAAPPTPRGRLHGICRGYLDFAGRHPALFELMFGFTSGKPALPAHDSEDTNAYQTLRDTCAPFVVPGQNPEVIEAQVWSLIHGYAVLSLSGRLNAPGSAPPPDTRFDEVMALLDRIGSDPSV